MIKQHNTQEQIIQQRQRRVRLYIEAAIIKDQEIQLNSEQFNYIINVMRCKNSDKIIIFNESYGEWSGFITVSKKSVYITPTDLLRLNNSVKDSLLTLCFAPTKKYSDFVLEKATEMSVDAIMPIHTERTIIDKISQDKYRKTVIEASEQSYRMDLPKIFDLTKIKDIKKNLELYHKEFNHLYVVCHTDDEYTINPSDLFQIVSSKRYTALTLIIGPEGGFSQTDIENIKTISENIVFLKIGSSIMRAETACIVGLTICNIALNKYL
jgi:16S rRNA (uracil1498-N3)-methyltransferase